MTKKKKKKRDGAPRPPIWCSESTVWSQSQFGAGPAAALTFGAQAGAGGEAGHVDDLHGELLARVPVDAAPHHAERTPATQMFS